MAPKTPLTPTAWANAYQRLLDEFQGREWLSTSEAFPKLRFTSIDTLNKAIRNGTAPVAFEARSEQGAGKGVRKFCRLYDVAVFLFGPDPQTDPLPSPEAPARKGRPRLSDQQRMAQDQNAVERIETLTASLDPEPAPLERAAPKPSLKPIAPPLTPGDFPATWQEFMTQSDVKAPMTEHEWKRLYNEEKNKHLAELARQKSLLT